MGNLAPPIGFGNRSANCSANPSANRSANFPLIFWDLPANRFSKESKHNRSQAMPRKISGKISGAISGTISGAISGSLAPLIFGDLAPLVSGIRHSAN